MHFRKLLRATKAICIRQLVSWQRRQQMRHHQGSNTNAPVAPSPPPLLLLAPFAFTNKNYGNRCDATCRAACDMVHTRVTLRLSLALFPSPAFACCTPNVEIYVYLYLCSTSPVQKVAESGEYLCYGQCLFYLSYMSRLVFPLLPACLLPYRVIRAFALMATQRHLLHFIFFYFLQFN